MTTIGTIGMANLISNLRKKIGPSFLERKVLFEKFTFTVEVLKSDLKHEMEGMTFKVKKGDIDEVSKDNPCYDYYKLFGFYTIVEGPYKNKRMMNLKIIVRKK